MSEFYRYTLAPLRRSTGTDPAQPPGTISHDEQAVLRSWLGGNHTADIAAARKMSPQQVARLIDDLCGFNRTHGRRVLDSGARLPLPGCTAAGPPDTWARALAEAEQRATELAERVDDLQRQLAAERERHGTPLMEYSARWCRLCREVVLPGHRHVSEPVSVAILTETRAVT